MGGGLWRGEASRTRAGVLGILKGSGDFRGSQTGFQSSLVFGRGIRISGGFDKISGHLTGSGEGEEGDVKGVSLRQALKSDSFSQDFRGHL